MFKIDEILKAAGARLASGNSGRRIRGISIDSRTTKRGELFIAIKGCRFDGHDFICDALRRGACGAAVAKPVRGIGLKGLKDAPVIIEVRDTLKTLGDIAAYHRRRFNIPVVGITGSNGKTSVKEMISRILRKRYNVLKNAGTENNLVGLPLTLLRLNRGHSLAVLEMGASHSGEIGRLAQILKPSIGLITNIGPSHLEFLKDTEGVLRTKKELVNRLTPKDLAVLNGDDSMLSRIRPQCKRVTFGLNKKNDFRAAAVKSSGYISFILNDSYLFRMNLLGGQNIYNALAAIAVSSNLGVDIPAIRRALSDFRLPPMRMELKNIKGIDIINDAYNSNPLSLKWAIDTFSAFKTRGKRILISGDMLELGRKGRLFHDRAGRAIAASSIDALITVGELSRYTALAAGRAGMKKRSLWPCRDSKEAADILKRIAKPGDAVLVKGSRRMLMEKAMDNI